jgi:hypothetical protein
MKKQRNCIFMAWLTILLISSIAVSVGVGHRQNWPDKIDNGSIRDSAQRVLEKL